VDLVVCGRCGSGSMWNRCGTDVEPEHVGAEETKTTTSSEPEVPQGINCLVCKYMIYEYITYMIYDAVLLIMICY
jgi:hypothetical protein